jgi:hypothetical protein
MHSEQEKAVRRARVAAAKDALARSVPLSASHVAPARAALRVYLRRLNEPRQPSDEMFQALIDAPFREAPGRGRG